jgi:hypothetical protein
LQRLHHCELQQKVQHSRTLNDNNSVKIALLHLQAFPATLKYSKITPDVRKRHQIIEHPVLAVASTARILFF